MSAPATQVTTMTELRRQTAAPEAGLPQVKIGFYDLQGFELMQRACKALAASTLVPQQFQNNISNCLIALEMAQRIGASPLMVMQNLYIVHGRPGWSSKFLIATFNQCGRFSAVRFEWQGKQGQDDWGCRAWAVEKATDEKIVGPLITIALAKKEGWHGKSGSKWQTIPELMLMYRAAGWMINTHAPEISMGLNTAEELGDTFDAARSGEGWAVETVGELRGQADPIVAMNANGEPEDAIDMLAEDAKREPVQALDESRFTDLIDAAKAAARIEDLVRLDTDEARAGMSPSQITLFDAAVEKRTKALSK